MYQLFEWQAFLDTCNDDTKPRKHNNSRTNGEYFAGTKSYEETMQFASNGWPQGLNAVKEVIANTSTTMGRSLGLQYDVAGFAPDIAAYCAGDPCHMMQKGDVFSATTRVITLKVNGCFNAGVQQETVVNRGVAIMGIVDYLEANDVRVELTYCSGNKSKGARFDYEVIIKRAEDPLDRDRAIFALANPSVHRRMFFHLIERDPNFKHWCSEAYGIPVELTEDTIDDAVYIPSANRGDYFSVEKSILTVLPYFECVLSSEQIEQIKDEI